MGKQQTYTGKRLERTVFSKLPPYNLEAERAVLGAILIENPVIFKAVEHADLPEDFYRETHQKVFNVLLDLIDRGEKVDLLLLRDELKRRKVLDEIGGPAYLAELVDSAPTAANVEFHVKLVHDKAVKRKLLNASIEIATRCYDDNEETDEILESAQQKVLGVAENRVKRGLIHVEDVLQTGVKKLEERAEHPGDVWGLPTGFTDIDSMLGGLPPSDLIIVAARPSMGKSAICLNMAQHIGGHEGVPTAIFSMEMSKEQLGIRLLCAEGRLNSHDIRAGRIKDYSWERIVRASDTLSQAPIYIDDTPALTVLELRAKAKRMQIEKGLGVVIVDYLQLMRSRRRHENRQQEVTELSRRLKALAKELDVPVVALSQLSRAVEQRADKRPQLSDLRESGSLEQDADVVMFIFRPEVYFDDAPKGIAEIIIGKQRNGPVGTVQLAFINEYTRFENLGKYRGAVIVPKHRDEWQHAD